jgi:hypothetical protein
MRRFRHPSVWSLFLWFLLSSGEFTLTRSAPAPELNGLNAYVAKVMQTFEVPGLA